MEYISVDKVLADMESGATPVNETQLEGIIDFVESLLAEYAQAVGLLGAVAPSKQAIKAWRDLLRRAKALQGKP